MNRTSIEWVKNPDGSQGFTFNPITGCLNGCEYCYARRLANGRLRQRYLANTNLAKGAKGGVSKLTIGNQVAVEREGDYANPFYPRFWEERIPKDRYITFKQIDRVRKKPMGIFVCDMGELFGDWIPQEWQEQIFRVIKFNPWHRFYLLTKQPQNLIKFSPFSPNCWVGVTATNREQYLTATSWKGLDGIKASVKYISFEPLLESIQPSEYRLKAVNWVIIGAMTGSWRDIVKASASYPRLTSMKWGSKWTLQPKIEWVEEIVRACDEAGVLVFLKDNLMPLLRESVVSWKRDLHYLLGGILRQEMPKEGLERLKGRNNA